MSLSAPLRAPDIAELETLVVCAAEGSLAGAAAQLGISRPAVAKRVRNLEALAGRPLLHRGAHGVRLTDAGAQLLAGARRILDERDVLMGVMTEIRGAGPSAIAGLRELLGHSPTAARAAHQPEARLAETERVLDLALRASATGVIISNPDTGVVHEVNDAFCRFTGRERADLVGRPAIESGAWYDICDRAHLIDEVRREGVAKGMIVRARREDGTVRVGEATARFVALAGTVQMLSTVDDITEQHRLETERAAGIAAYRAVTQLAALLLAGRPVLEGIGSVLPELRRSGGFATALLWDLEGACPRVIDGDEPPRELHLELRAGEPLPDGSVTRLGGTPPASGAVIGWAVPLARVGHSVILLATESPAASTQALFAEVLDELATVASVGG